MELDNGDPYGSRDQPLSRDEHPWLAERNPTRLDAEHAHQPLDPAFVLSFRHAIAEEASNDVVYLDDNIESLISSTSATTDLFYPLTLTPALPDLPSGITLEQLLEAFRSNVHRRMPLIHYIPIESIDQTHSPGYLAYSMAALGSLTVPNATSAAHSLWSTARSLITASLEVDNREARKPSLITAWVIMATYGALCADETSWHQMNVCHGYVVTAARRLYHSLNSDSRWYVFHHSSGQDDTQSTYKNSNTMQALLLADVLRSVHYNSPLAVPTLEYLSGPADFQSSSLRIYRSLVLEGQPPPKEYTGDGPLIALVAMLADIHTFTQFFYPLSLGGETIDSSSADASLDFQTPFVPLSIKNESRLVSKRLQKSLDLWASAYMSVCSADEKVLYYLCKMYIALPSMQVLPALAKYTPRMTRDGLAPDQSSDTVDMDLKKTPEAQTYAWRILDLVDHRQGLATCWLPIAVFYACLVVWRASELSLGDASQGSRKVMLLFRQELTKMGWPCCGVMVEAIDNLRAQ
ncbi:hypothetical protein FMEXI_12155 [Fusarium mexicanum]|uniref:Uncharacterized protein n=1 Tax=Fusarium mexicanum TaxID=751941 RepID=A0A8H5IBM0_9HYPO|nr:hypothetical protein FMEXI_12155 [Fusarium mexicanum]